MHMIIYTLVEASTQDEALDKGKTVFRGLVGHKRERGSLFDDFRMFDEDDAATTEEGRSGEQPTAAPVETDDGNELLERGWESTREVVETDSWLSKVSLYDDQGDEIRSRERLDQILDESDELWIVPADVHF